MIKAVFFDAIDTLFCAYPNKIEMYRRIIKEHTGLEVPTEKMTEVWYEVIDEAELAAKNEIDSQTPIMAWEGFNSKILKKVGYQGDDIEKRGEELRLESWTNPKNFVLFDDVIPTLEKLSEQNILIGCISNEAEGLNKFFTHFGIDKYFSNITISEVIGCEKPNALIFETALQAVKLRKDEVLFIGDSLISDYEGANSCGIKSFLIDRDQNIIDNNIRRINSLLEIVDILEKEKAYGHTTT